MSRTRLDRPTIALPSHWTPDQALAVFECLQAMQEALWALYGAQVQQAWRDQFAHDSTPPQLHPDAPF